MNRIFLYILFLLLPHLCGISVSPAEAKYKVLVLHSYHPDLPWEEGLKEGIDSVLQKGGPPVELYHEYLDNIRYPGNGIFSEMDRLLGQKYSGGVIDAIMTTDDVALNFILERGNRLFPGVPVVFCAPNDFSFSRIQGWSQITGIAEKPDVKGTLELICRLHPDITRIAVVSDRRPSTINSLNEIGKIKPQFENRIDIDILTDESLEKLEWALARSPETTAVLFFAFLKDASGRRYGNNLKVLKRISEFSPLPFYTYKKIDVGMGVVGGMVIDEKLLGAEAMGMVFRILKGESADSIPIIYDTPTVPMFDYIKLKQFDIDAGLLPQDSVVVNKPLSLKQIHGNLFWPLILTLAILTAMVLSLILNIVKRIGYERELEHIHGTLEQKVESRTAELAAMNDLLLSEVNERKRAEAELENTIYNYRNIFENAPVGIFRSTPEGKYLIVNDEFAQSMGFQSGDQLLESVGNISDLYVDAEQREDVKRLLKRFGRIRGYEIHIRRQKSGTVWMAIYVRSVKTDSGEIAYYDGFTLDITRRKEMEQELQENEERLKAISEANPDPIVVYDKFGFPQYLNPAFTEVFGWTLAEIAGGRIPFVPDDQKELTNKKISTFYKTGGPVRFETKRLTKTGVLLDVHVSAASVKTAKGKPYKMIVNLTDITHVKKLEARLQQKHKMEAVGTLAGGIAHDFNNILGIILGNTELAMDDIPHWSPARNNLEKIQTSILRARDVVMQLLSFSRKTEHELKPVDVSPVLKESVKLLRATIPTNIDIHAEVKTPCKCISADPTQIHQILINLCTNAAHAMTPGGGKLTVSLKSIVLKANERPPGGGSGSDPAMREYVEIVVSDTGSGIPPEIRDRIFDPYFTTRDIGKGTGMGLAVVHGIVLRHDGIISVESVPGEGSNFRILFPAVDSVVSTPAEGSLEFSKGYEHILFVDDEDGLASMGKQILERLGYSVMSYTDPIDALKAFRSSPDDFDLIITDMTMPGMNGIQLIQEIKKIQPLTPSIICTGYSELIDEKRAEEFGIDRYIEKPLNKQELSSAIRFLLDR